MKYKLLSVSEYSKKHPADVGVNIGDYIQALASSQFYPTIDGFLDRDTDLKKYTGEECKMIMNGWYMKEPENWPPSNKIHPLFVAFHINSIAKDHLLSAESLKYLKQHEPIGCRDKRTVEILKEKGVDAYFSGCMTLTLGYKYANSEKDGKIYIVDPIYDGNITATTLTKGFGIILRHPQKIFRLVFGKKLNLQNGRNVLMNLFKVALFYREYATVFGDNTVMQAIYITQDSLYYKDHFKSDSERLSEAERLIRQYAKAGLVITSRIHCALPCLGLGTPVVYLEKVNDSETSLCRLDGLKELFNVVQVDKGKLRPLYPTTMPITTLNAPKNKRNWRPLSQELISRCREFIN